MGAVSYGLSPSTTREPRFPSSSGHSIESVLHIIGGTKMTNDKSSTAQLVRVGLNTRNFCGDEREAIQQEAYDMSYGKLSEATMEGLLELVDREWKESLSK